MRLSGKLMILVRNGFVPRFLEIFIENQCWQGPCMQVLFSAYLTASSPSLCLYIALLENKQISPGSAACYLWCISFIRGHCDCGSNHPLMILKFCYWRNIHSNNFFALLFYEAHWVNSYASLCNMTLLYVNFLFFSHFFSKLSCWDFLGAKFIYSMR